MVPLSVLTHCFIFGMRMFSAMISTKISTKPMMRS